MSWLSKYRLRILCDQIYPWNLLFLRSVSLIILTFLTFYEHLLFLCHFTTSTPISNTYVSLKDKLMLFCGNVLVVLPLCIALLNPFNGAQNISLNGPSSSVSKLKGNYLPFDFWLLTNCGVAPRTWYRANRQKYLYSKELSNIVM